MFTICFLRSCSFSLAHTINLIKFCLTLCVVTDYVGIPVLHSNPYFPPDLLRLPISTTEVLSLSHCRSTATAVRTAGFHRNALLYTSLSWFDPTQLATKHLAAICSILSPSGGMGRRKYSKSLEDLGKGQGSPTSYCHRQKKQTRLEKQNQFNLNRTTTIHQLNQNRTLSY